VTDLPNRAKAVLDKVFGFPVAVESVERVDGGRGAFSEVERVCYHDQAGSRHFVVVKHARRDANGEAAIAAGAYQREALAYETILPATAGIRRPHFHGAVRHSSGAVTLVLQDLTSHRAVDQVLGLAGRDALAVALALVELHQWWVEPAKLEALDVRRATPSKLAPEGLQAGLAAVKDQWGSHIDKSTLPVLADLVDQRQAAVHAFTGETGQTLCHGDPRADNVVFDDVGAAVVFDWQQMAVQFGEADLAWLLATSTTAEVRREIEADVVATYAIARAQDAATTWRRYQLGMVLPGLAVLFLAQRQADTPRASQLVATSLNRIATAVSDLGVVDLVKG